MTMLDREEFRLEVAYAHGNDRDVIEHPKQLHHNRGWTGGHDSD